MTKAGYELGRDGQGLTSREREVLKAMMDGTQFVDIAAKIGVTKQRVSAVVSSLIRKGRVVKTDGGDYAVVVKR